MNKVFLPFSLALIVTGCGSEPKQETSLQRSRRWQAEAEVAARSACSNDLVGISRIIDVTVMDSATHPNQWEAYATCEYVNQVGGIDRTNVYLRFRTTFADGSNQTHVFAFRQSLPPRPRF